MEIDAWATGVFVGAWVHGWVQISEGLPWARHRGCRVGYVNLSAFAPVQWAFQIRGVSVGGSLEWGRPRTVLSQLCGSKEQGRSAGSEWGVRGTGSNVPRGSFPLPPAADHTGRGLVGGDYWGDSGAEGWRVPGSVLKHRVRASCSRLPLP